MVTICSNQRFAEPEISNTSGTQYSGLFWLVHIVLDALSAALETVHKQHEDAWSFKPRPKQLASTQN